jgi:hypothetical protein
VIGRGLHAGMITVWLWICQDEITAASARSALADPGTGDRSEGAGIQDLR